MPFIGKNDAGKSNILKALDLFFKSRKSNDYQESLKGGGGGESSWKIDIRDYRLFFGQKSGVIDITGHLKLNEKEVNKLFPEEIIKIEDADKEQTFDKRDIIDKRFIISTQITSDNNLTADCHIKLIKMDDLEIYNHDEDRALRTDDGHYSYGEGRTKVFALLLEMLRDVFFTIPAVRHIGREDKLKGQLLPDGAYMPSEYLKYEKDVSARKYDLFGQIEENMRSLTTEYKHIASMEDDENQVEVYFDRSPSSSIGDGTKQQFIKIFNLDLYGHDVIVGIEEPEIHLHPEQQRKMFDFLKEQSKTRQIIITTHSSIFTGSSDQIKTYLVKKTNGSTKLKAIKREEFNLIKRELGLRNTDIFFDNCVVLIEGDTENVALPIITEALNYDLLEKGIRLVNITGKDDVKKKKIKQFLKYMKDSDVIIYLILDNDKGVSKIIGDLIREELLSEDNYKMWDEEFEDCFGEDRIVQAMKEIASEDGWEFDITAEELRSKKEESGRHITKVLGKLLREKDLHDLEKPRLGEKLGLIIATEIKGDSADREVTEPEKAIKNIFKLVGGEEIKFSSR